MNEFLACIKSFYRHRFLENGDVFFTYGHNTPMDTGYTEGGREIDCSALVGMALMGLTFEESPYAGVPLHVGPFSWALDLRSIFYPMVSHIHPVRVASQICQMMEERNWSVDFREDFSNVRPGDIIFYAKKHRDGSWVQPNRYKHVCHVAVVSDMMRNTDDRYEIGPYPYKHTLIEASTGSPVLFFTVLEKRRPGAIVSICRLPEREE